MRFWPDPHGYVSLSAILPSLAGVFADAERPGNAGPTVPARTSAPRSLNVTMIAERELGVAVATGRGQARDKGGTVRRGRGAVVAIAGASASPPGALVTGRTVS